LAEFEVVRAGVVGLDPDFGLLATGVDAGEVGGPRAETSRGALAGETVCYIAACAHL